MNWNDVVHEMYRGAAEQFGPRVCVVPTRYGGAYEGGKFAAIPVGALSSVAFGQDLAAAEWWDENAEHVGVGNTPDEALAAWYAKRQVKA